MARILIGWEFGANRGHAVRAARLAAALREAGHEIVFAVQRIDSLSQEESGGAPVWQAPLSPRLLVTGSRAPAGAVVGMAEILARLGMDDEILVAAMIRAWDRLFVAVGPDAVIADFAPFLLMAARGRLATVAVGGGFELPPAGLDRFPALAQGAAGADQGVLLDTVNAGLAAAGREPLEALPRTFAADRAMVGTFAELDPYGGQRREPLALPIERGFEPAAGDGEEVFVYAPERLTPDAPLWGGLAAAGLKVRVHVARAPRSLREALDALGLVFEPEPVPFARIAERSRLLVSHGGHQFVCAGLAAGLPHVVCHYDLEKLLTGVALARTGLGGHVALASIQPAAFGESLARLHRDEALAARAREAAPGFRERPGAPVVEAVTEAIAALV